jgi:AraC family transcriptional regulator of arabinose operon
MDMDYRIIEVLEFIDSNLQAGLELSDIALLVGLSSSRVRHIFTAAIGISLMRYLRLRRMQKAKVLLEETVFSVKEIIAKVGINDASHFVRDFKNHYGLTPTEYRSRHFASIRNGSLQDHPEDRSILSPESFLIQFPGEAKSANK